MNKDLVQKKNDYLLELALEEQLDHDEDMQKYSEEVVEPHEFSPEHEARMRELFKKAEKVEKRAGRKRTRIQVAAGIAVVLCCSQVDAFRVPVYNFFTEVKEKATRFGVEEKTGQVLELSEKHRVEAPKYIPEGYYVDYMEETKSTFFINYINDESEGMYNFRFQSTITDVVIDTENATTIEINGNHAYVVEKDKYVRILMHKNDHLYYLAGAIPCEEAIKIMESIE